MHSSLNSLLQTKISNIKLLILDVDGVLTDGKIWFMPNGEELKCFYVQDGYGIKQLQKSGITVAVISGRNSPMVSKRMNELGVEHCYQGNEDKWAIAEKLISQLHLKLNQVAYMGDDTPDLSVMTKIGFSIAVANAVPEVKKIADWCTVKKGGEGAVREVCDLFLTLP